MPTPPPTPSVTSSLVRGLLPAVLIGLAVLGWSVLTHQPDLGNLVAGAVTGVGLVAVVILVFAAVGPRRPY
jgi:multisubunit Na+/H+ antiporter MnhE subunit